MTFQEGLQLFTTQARATSPLEWVAIAAAVAEVLLARANKVWLYPAGLISTLLYTYIFLKPSVRLYADAILNLYYFIMSIYGWLHWLKPGGRPVLPVTFTSRIENVQAAVLSIAGWGALYLLLTKVFPAAIPGYVISDVALWDAFISSTAWVGMWLLARRKVENWLVLNISNLVAIPVYVYKAMPFTAVLTLFLFIVAIFGYFEWRKQAFTAPAALS